MAKAQPSDLELQVLSVLWGSGPSTVRQVHESLPDGKKRAYTTVLTVLQHLEHKKLVKHRREGNSHVYIACADRDQVLEPLMQRLLRHVFGGQPAQAMQYLLSDPSVDANELKAIRALLDRHEHQREKETGK